MAKLKLGAIADDKSVKLTVELPAAVHRDLLAYAEVLARETGQEIAEPAKLIAPMLARLSGGAPTKASGLAGRTTWTSAATQIVTGIIALRKLNPTRKRAFTGIDPPNC
jgi:hypothetical protein